MHDFQRSTAQALPQLLADLKAAGFKVVHLRPKSVAETLPQYDAMMSQEIKAGPPTPSPRTVSCAR